MKIVLNDYVPIYYIPVVSRISPYVIDINEGYYQGRKAQVLDIVNGYYLKTNKIIPRLKEQYLDDTYLYCCVGNSSNREENELAYINIYYTNKSEKDLNTFEKILMTECD
jgi:hypothetical protein